jgi:hypothetical protein
MPRVRDSFTGLCLAATVVLCFGVAFAEPSQAGEPAKAAPLPCIRCLVCPDDYHPKPWPCLPPSVCCGCCDDYDCKPLPLIPCPVTGCDCEAYCPKPLPCPPGAYCPPWFKCPLPFCQPKR